jgi:hypothetical protein
MAKKRTKTKSLDHDDSEPLFNLFTWRASIPLCDDLWLGMQAQNIAIVDHIIRHFEQQALQHYYANDSFSMEHLAPLSAMSQMWVFALYEFLRTWLERASKLIGYSEKLAAQKTPEERAAYEKKIDDEAKARAKFIKIAPHFYTRHVSSVGDPDFIKAIRDYREEIKHLFRDVEAIRLPLAKHVIAGTKTERFMAEAPGYGRVDTMTGSMYWQINLAEEGYVDVINRHKLADAFMSMNRAKARMPQGIEGFEVENVSLARARLKARLKARTVERDTDAPSKPPLKKRRRKRNT